MFYFELISLHVPLSVLQIFHLQINYFHRIVSCSASAADSGNTPRLTRESHSLIYHNAIAIFCKKISKFIMFAQLRAQ